MPGKWLVPSEACEWLSECLLLLLSWSDLLSFFNTLSTSNSLLNHGLGICNPQLAGIFSSRSLHVEENFHTPQVPGTMKRSCEVDPCPFHYILSHPSVCFLHSHSLQNLIDMFACVSFIYLKMAKFQGPSLAYSL